MFGRHGRSLQELIGEMRAESTDWREESRQWLEEWREESRQWREEARQWREEARRRHEEFKEESKRRDEEFKLESKRRDEEFREFNREILLRNEKVYTSAIAQLEKNTAEVQSSTEETRTQTQALLRVIDRLDETGGAAAA